MMNTFGQTGNAASQLGEKGAYEIMEPQLKKLAAKHVSSGVADAHFEVRHPFLSVPVAYHWEIMSTSFLKSFTGNSSCTSYQWNPLSGVLSLKGFHWLYCINNLSPLVLYAQR